MILNLCLSCILRLNKKNGVGYLLKNKVIVLTFLIFSSILFAENLGDKLFLEDANFYFISNGKNIFDVNEEETKLAKEIITEYTSFKAIQLNKLTENGNYAISLNKIQEKEKIVFIKELLKEEFEKTSLFKNENLKVINFDKYKVYYSLKKNERFIYTHFEDKLYLSNNYDLFFELLTNLSDEEQKALALKDKIAFETLMNNEGEFDYKYYLVEKGSKLMHNFNERAVYSKGDEKTKYYYLSEELEEQEEKEYNFSDYILDTPDFIKIGRDLKEFLDLLKKDTELVKAEDFSELEEYLKINLDLILHIKKETEDYFILYTENEWTSYKERLIEEYERAFFYKKKLSVDKADSGMLEIKIPLLDIRTYAESFQKKYLIISKNKDVFNNISIGKYYNFDYSKIKNTQLVETDYKAREEKVTLIKDRQIIEYKKKLK